MKQQSTIDYLKKLSSSPYDPETPQKHLSVNFFMSIAKILGMRGRITPHLYKGNNVEKILYEYNNAASFLNILETYLGKDIFNDKTILDVGCGWGGKDIYYCEHTKLKTITGFDIPGVFDSTDALQFASTKNINNCFFTTGYAENIPFENNKFDIVIMEDVLEHVKNPTRVLQECFRVLKRGGKLIVKFPSFKGMLSHHLDRAITMPALHYILSMKIWAQGLNYLLLDPHYKLSYEPFDKIISTPYHKCITQNLNGLDFNHFQAIIRMTSFDIIIMKLMPFIFITKHQIIKPFYNTLWRCKPLREFLSNYILFIGTKSRL